MEVGGVYRMGFTKQELHDLLTQAGFRNVYVRGLFNFHPYGVSRLPFLLKPYAWADGVLANLPLSAHRGKHLLAVGTK